MQQIKLSIQIDAPKEKVWKTLLDDKTYRLWAEPFCEGSYAESDWKTGSKARFLSPGGSGLVSQIIEHIPNEKIEFEHLGILKDGEEDYESDAVKSWKGARENYFVTEKNGKTELTIEQDISDNEAFFFKDAWEKALQKLKELSEKNN